MPDTSVRLPLVEDYDPSFGFILDGFVDPENSGRKPFMARPAIKTDRNMGAAPNPSPGSHANVLAAEVFLGTGSSPSNKSAYMAFVYCKFFLGGLSYGVAVYDYTNSVYMGGTNLTGTILALPGPIGRAKFSAPANPPSAVTGGTIAAGGAGYAVNDQIVITLSTGNTATFIVTSQTAGAITGIALMSFGITGVTPANPVAQTSSSGAGTGATINVNYELVDGLIFQYSVNSSATEFVGIGRSSRTYYEHTINNSPTAGYATPTVVALNNYNFYLDADGNIWNSNAGDPTIIDGLSFTPAFSDPNVTPIDLAVHNGYLLAIGSSQTRYFQVTGAINGSSVAPIQNLDFGLGSRQFTLNQRCSTVISQDEVLAMVGEDDSTGAPVYLFTPGSLAPSRVSFPLIENIISDELIDISGIYVAAFIKFRGHLCYLLLGASGVTYLFDVTTKLWYRWSTPVNTYGDPPSEAITVFDGVTFFVSYDVDSDSFYISRLFEAGSDTIVGYTAPAYFPTITTKPMDLGTLNSKTFYSAAIVGDQVGSAISATLSYSDDDGQNYSTGRIIPLNQKRPMARNLGSAYRRCWRITLPTSWDARLDALEVTFRVGVT